MSNRDDFSKETKLRLAQRSSYFCANPDCNRVTVGPNLSPDRSTVLGVAAHIYAASPGGKRFDPNMPQDQRKAIENGIWLCQDCGKLIDSDEIKYSANVLKRWKVDHEDVAYKHLVHPEYLKKAFLEVAPRKIPANILNEVGFKSENLGFILQAQERAYQQGNDRLISYLNRFVGQELRRVPFPWRAMIAGLPIIAKDIRSDSLKTLSALVEELHPYLSKQMRTEYHRRATPLLVGVLAELQSFIDDSSRSGGLPMVVLTYAPATWKDPLSWSGTSMKPWKVDDSLIRGCWSYGIPQKVSELKISIGDSWNGFLFGIISRLPDPDRQRGKILTEWDFPSMIFNWCSTSVEDFRPPLNSIVRYPVNASDRTLAGIYKTWKDNSLVL